MKNYLTGKTKNLKMYSKSTPNMYSYNYTRPEDLILTNELPAPNAYDFWNTPEFIITSSKRTPKSKPKQK